jgi:hypothetical protein
VLILRILNFRQKYSSNSISKDSDKNNGENSRMKNGKKLSSALEDRHQADGT